MILMFFAILYILAQASYVKDGKYEKFSVVYQVCVIAFISGYFFFYSVPNSIPHSDFSDMTLVETYSGDYTLKVDFEKVVQEYEDFDNNGNSKIVTYVEYRPTTIYWPNGGYTFLNSNAETDKLGGYVSTSASDDYDEEYIIHIPDRNFSYTEKMANISIYYWIFMVIIWLIGAGSIIVYYSKIDNNKAD